MKNYLEVEKIKEVLKEEYEKLKEHCKGSFEMQLAIDEFYNSIMNGIHRVPRLMYDEEQIRLTLYEQTEYITRLETTINTMMEVCKQ